MFQSDVTCKIIFSNMLMFKQEFNYSEFAVKHATVTSFSIFSEYLKSNLKTSSMTSFSSFVFLKILE
jgi:hypothetical protein